MNKVVSTALFLPPAGKWTGAGAAHLFIPGNEKPLITTGQYTRVRERKAGVLHITC